MALNKDDYGVHGNGKVLGMLFSGYVTLHITIV